VDENAHWRGRSELPAQHQSAEMEATGIPPVVREQNGAPEISELASPLVPFDGRQNHVHELGGFSR
jgi:hypothetical protein